MTMSTTSNSPPSSSQQPEADKQALKEQQRGKIWLLPCSITQLGVGIAHEVIKSSGSDIVVLASSNAESASTLVTEYPNRCLLVDMDPLDSTSMQRAVSTTIKAFGFVDILVNSTPKAYIGLIKDIDEWQLKDQFKATFQSMVNSTQVLLPTFQQQGFGHIVNVTDTNGMLGTPSLGALSSALHAVEGYSEGMALQLAQYGIKVSIVQTGQEVTLISNPNYIAGTPSESGPNNEIFNLVLHANKFPEEAFQDAVHAVVSIGGIKNPPIRIIAGNDAIELIREKISTLSEEVDDFV